MRWKFVIPAVILVALIVVFNIVFLDRLIARAIIAGGEKIFGARVELDRLTTRFSNLSVTIEGLRAANRNDVWKNLFETASVRFSVEPLPLLSKKVVINEMAVDGVRWGTRRTTSGALPPRVARKVSRDSQREDKNSVTARLMRSISARAAAEASALPPVEAYRNIQKNIAGITSVDKAVAAADLASVREIESLQKIVNERSAYYENAYRSLNAQDKISQLQTAINEVQQIKFSGIQDVAPAKAKIDNLNRSRQELQTMYDTVQALKVKLSQDLDTQKDLVERINRFKDEDVKRISSKLQIPSLSMGNVSKAVFGPVWLNRVDRITYYVHLARKYMPPRKKEDKKLAKRRGRGMNIAFPKRDNPPDFLIRRIALNGSTGGPGKAGQAIAFSGTINDITSDQRLLGRPTTALINGTQGSIALSLNGMFDHAGDVPLDRIDISYRGFDARDLGLKVNSGILPSIGGGTGLVTASFALSGDQVNGAMGLTLNNITLQTGQDAAGNPEVTALLQSLWSGISMVTVNAGVKGTADNLSMSITSNLDQLLADRFKNIYGAKLAEVNSRIHEEINRRTADAQKQLTDLANARKQELLGQYSGVQEQINSRLNEAKNLASQKQNEAGGQVEREKNKVQEDLKKQAEEKLKGMFKF